MHNLGLPGPGAEPVGLRALALLHEEDGVEHDGFCEGNREDRLHQNLGRRAGIAPHGLGGLHADESHADGRAERRQADV